MNTGQTRSAGSLVAFIKRLHFYIGLFVGPFIFMAALTGTIYVITPQLEQRVYQQELTATTQGDVKPLSAQIAAAQKSLPYPLDIKSVRPAPSLGQTTRVLFNDPELDRYRARTVFVDPITLEIKGELASYGTSGVLPLRIALDFMHTDLLLGPVGRYYSELAASWMWIAALGGVLLWWQQRRSFTRQTKAGSFAQARSYHAKVAIWISLGLLFFSATGLTWSKWAGGNIAEWRQAIGWVTPSVSRDLTPHHDKANSNSDLHANHHNMSGMSGGSKFDVFDQVEQSAREFGIDAGKIEIVPAPDNKTAWVVKEIDRSWPTQVDSVSIDPMSMSVVDFANFKDFPFVAKLIRWGIDAHMGILFGLPNQLLLAAFGLALCTVIVWGYTMWWKRRPMMSNTPQTLMDSWMKLSGTMKVVSIVVAVALGLALPIMGCSLTVFCLIDVIRWRRVGYQLRSVS
nr:PepSY-associated TM helix domain-containing protein [uncultured Vibrio sp.]